MSVIAIYRQLSALLRVNGSVTRIRQTEGIISSKLPLAKDSYRHLGFGFLLFESKLVREQAATMTRPSAGLVIGFVTTMAVLSLAVNQAQESPKAPREMMEIRARYLGVTGWEITDGKTHILIDPYISRVPGPPQMKGRLQPDGRAS